MSNYFLIILILIAIIAIIYVWYVTRYQNLISETDHLKLDNDENKLFGDWYENNLNPNYDFTITTTEIAIKFLQRIYQVDIDSDLIIVGTNIDKQYYKIAGKRLNRSYI